MCCFALSVCLFYPFHFHVSQLLLHEGVGSRMRRARAVRVMGLWRNHIKNTKLSCENYTQIMQIMPKSYGKRNN